MAGLQNLLTMRFDISSRPGKGVRHLQVLARASVTVDALLFGHIWFRPVIRVRRTGVFTDRATGKHLPSSPRMFMDPDTCNNFSLQGVNACVTHASTAYYKIIPKICKMLPINKINFHKFNN